jgi:hypothetical protein
LLRGLEQIAFGSTPIVAALAERGDAVNDRVYTVYKSDSTELQSAQERPFRRAGALVHVVA